MLLKLCLCFVFGGRVLELGVKERLKQEWKHISWFGRKTMVAVNTGQKGNFKNVAAVELVGCCLEAELQIKLTPKLRKPEKSWRH